MARAVLVRVHNGKVATEGNTMIFTIDWHKKCLFNVEETLRKAVETLVRQTQEVERLRAKVALMRGQIERAEREGIKEYDAEKFNKSRGSR